MRESIKYCILLWILVLWLPGRAASIPDEAENYRAFSEEKLEQYRADEDFQYVRETYSAVPLWEQFQQWLAQWWESLFGMTPSGENILLFFYILAGLIMLYAIIKLFGVDFSGLVRKEAPVGQLDYEVKEENIREIDFALEMEKAREQRQWRLVIRLQYLLALKQLQDAGLLQVRNGKTNHDYLYELAGKECEPGFARLSRIFEYTWYGHFEPNEGIRLKAENELTKLQNQLRH